jgi:membrane protease YdiL (CAAX protease family)
MGLAAPESWNWFWIGPVVAGGILAGCAITAWAAFGWGPANWFVQHARALDEAAVQMPSGASAGALFVIVTVPALAFSPLAEEFLYRGFLLTDLSERWGARPATIIQAAAFAGVHLAHYGLSPLQPALMAVWVPSMFVAALVFAWIVKRSGSLWPAVVAHGVFNLGMNGLVFVFLPGHVGA